MGLLFKPFSLLAALVAGMVAARVLDWVWARFSDEEMPGPEHRDIPRSRLIGALVAEGVTARVVRGLFDNQARRGFERVTGTWPGQVGPEPT
jgi:hypothetical protein